MEVSPRRRRRICTVAIVVTFLAALVRSPVSVHCYTEGLPWRKPRLRSSPSSVFLLATTHSHSPDPEDDASDGRVDATGNPSRRQLLKTLAAATVALPVAPALAGKAEIDKLSGSLYSPKSEMLSGGSAAARGISVSQQRPRLQPGQALQTVYDARFITYLARFLLNFDPAAGSWWVETVKLVQPDDGGVTSYGISRDEVDTVFAEFAESVEIGLADYFVGPYGSYSSLSAMKAGLTASKPARSARVYDPREDLVGFMGMSWNDFFIEPQQKRLQQMDRDSIIKQGVLNLYTLLKARYTSVSAKRQLAILFSFISDPDLQPTQEIQSLLGEADNVTLTAIELNKSVSNSESTSRTSSRRGGGYGPLDTPDIMIDPPPALGSSYKCAKARAIMVPTSRILKIRVLDGGEGYFEKPPEVRVSGLASRTCTCCAILDRDGHVESVLVLDPGYGYGGRRQEPPKVTIAPPPSKEGRRAVATAQLEYEVDKIQLYEGGNGYVATEPPRIVIAPPDEDPDWFVETPTGSVVGSVGVEVFEMRDPDGVLAFSVDAPARSTQRVRLERVSNNPLALLPWYERPERNSLGMYVIPAIAAVATRTSSPNPRFRAVDPIFGAIGKVPFTKSAMELKPSEYARLALSGAVCTVLVRTALNPLELIKTKQQLRNDEELFDFARKRKKQAVADFRDESSLSDISEERNSDDQRDRIGALEMIFSLVELRGLAALFQSADITFLASLVFGSFGFGATELFRRSFTMAFFTEGSEFNAELILLLAATVATVITSAAAAPFELLRVRSMGVVEPKKWTEVLESSLQEKPPKPISPNIRYNLESDTTMKGGIDLKKYLPLWAGFPPTASRELAFAIPKFLAFDIIAKTIVERVNDQLGPGSLPVQVGVGTAGLAISAISGALAGIAGAVVSHPADLILTYTSAGSRTREGGSSEAADWREVVKDLLSRDGGIANLFVGLVPRLVFFFLVIGLQFFLYDYVKNLLNVGSDDLSLVLDVFYAVRQGLLDISD